MAGRHTDTVAGAATVLLAVGEGLAGAVVDEVGRVAAEGLASRCRCRGQALGVDVRLGLDLSGGNLAVLAGLLGAGLDGIGVQACHGGLVVVVATVVATVVSAVVLPAVVLVSALLSTLTTTTVVVVVVVVVLAVSTTAEAVLSPHQGRGLEVVDGSGLGDDGQTQEGRQCVLDQHVGRREERVGCRSVWELVKSRRREESVGARPKRIERGMSKRSEQPASRKERMNVKHTNTAHSKKKTKWVKRREGKKRKAEGYKTEKSLEEGCQDGGEPRLVSLYPGIEPSRSSQQGRGGGGGFGPPCDAAVGVPRVW